MADEKFMATYFNSLVVDSNKDFILSKKALGRVVGPGSRVRFLSSPGGYIFCEQSTIGLDLVPARRACGLHSRKLAAFSRYILDMNSLTGKN
jgi:hypothetical protein